ncbi:OmpH family outer membrane protein [Nafulsella turpanensis]|uniref:OmpH family outer membrane protein n=1 Tax=Nafulsella turpanensis TaxID=1265690 RepID=UPI00035D429F|nr:OmpH family outer membrane protein [Nafulsella turpanensis]
MKNKFVLALTALMLAGFSVFAQGTTNKPIKIGYASVNYILSEMPEYKQIEQQLMEYEKQLSNQLQSQYQELQTKATTYQQSAETMLPEIRQQKETELRELQGRIEKFQRDAQQLIQKKEADLLAPAYDKIQKNIDVVAAENNYTHVLNSEVAGVPTLLFVSDQSHDISNLILKKMGITPTQE